MIRFWEPDGRFCSPDWFTSQQSYPRMNKACESPRIHRQLPATRCRSERRKMYGTIRCRIHGAYGARVASCGLGRRSPRQRREQPRGEQSRVRQPCGAQRLGHLRCYVLAGIVPGLGNPNFGGEQGTPSFIADCLAVRLHEGAGHPPPRWRRLRLAPHLAG